MGSFRSSIRNPEEMQDNKDLFGFEDDKGAIMRDTIK